MTYFKLSIITINFNNLEGLKKTVESVLSQTFNNYEYIIIDGGSTDGSKEYIESHKEIFNYWVSEADEGIYNAMNKGISQTHGDYLLFMNSGDWLCTPNVLEEVMANELKADITYGDLYVTSQNNTFLKEYPADIDLSYLIKHSLPHPSMFFKKKVFQLFGNYETHYTIVADWAYYFKLFVHKNASFGKLDITVSYFDYAGLSSRNDTQEKVYAERQKVIDMELPKAAQDLIAEYSKLKRSNMQLRANRLVKLAISLTNFKKKILKK